MLNAHEKAAIATAVAALSSLLDTPAKPARKAPAKGRKPQPKAVPATKGSKTRTEQSRKDWNRTLTAKARLAGKHGNHPTETVYAVVLRDWEQIQAKRDAGLTPDQVLAQYV